MPSDRPDGSFAEPRRLHPASILLGVSLRQLLQLFVYPAVASPAGLRAVLVVLAVVAAVGLASRVLAWQRFRYSFDGEVLRVDEGVLNRNHRALDVDRIQLVEVDRSFPQRVLGLAALRVETAGSAAEVEVDLRVITFEEAQRLRDAVRAGKTRAATGDGEVDAGATATVERREVLRVPLRRVVLASVTGIRLLVFPALVGGALQFVDEETVNAVLRAAGDTLRDRGLLGEMTETPFLAGAAIVAGAALLSVVTAVVVGVLRDANFRVDQVGDDLHVSRGLLGTRDSILPLRRIQVVQLHRNWLRDLIGATALRIHSAGGSAAAERRVTIPLVPVSEVDAAVRELYPGVAGVPDLRRHPRAALRRAIVRWVRRAVLAVAVVWAVGLGEVDPLRWSVLAVLTVLIGAAGLGALEYRRLAHGLTDRLVASRRGALNIVTSLAPVAKVQAVTTRATWFQLRLDVATVRAHVAGPGGDVEVLDVGAEHGRELHRSLLERAALPERLPVGDG